MMPPSLRSFDLNLLVLFDTLYETRKLGEAARRIGLSQPAASQALTRLRDTFDDRLFERRGRGMEPTPLAHALAPAVREALGGLERCLLSLREFDPSKSDREFRIGLAALGEMTFFPRLVHAVRSEAPNVRLRSVPSHLNELQQLALQREVDLGVDFRPPPHPDLRHERVMESELVFVARKGHPRVGADAQLSDLMKEHFVWVDLDDATRARFTELVGFESLLEVRATAIVGHYTSLPSVVMECDSVAVVPRAFVESSQVYLDALQLLPIPIPVAPMPAYIYWHESYGEDPGHAWLRSVIRSVIDLRERG